MLTIEVHSLNFNRNQDRLLPSMDKLRTDQRGLYAVDQHI
jgi:hypothetical protein